MPLRNGRQPKLVALGLVLVLGCAALGLELARREARPVRYLELARPVAAGGLIQAADLTTASMSRLENLDAIPYSEASQVVGSRAVETLVAGSLLLPADLEHASPPGPSSALVGTSLQADQAPAGLAVGDSVLVVFSPSGAGSAAPATSTRSVMARGSVFAIAGASSGNGVDVTIAVPTVSAAAVATASAGGQLSLVELPPGASGGAVR